MYVSHVCNLMKSDRYDISAQHEILVTVRAVCEHLTINWLKCIFKYICIVNSILISLLAALHYLALSGLFQYRMTARKELKL